MNDKSHTSHSDKSDTSNSKVSSIDISVIVPLYNEEESLLELHDWIKKVMQDNNFSYEIIRKHTKILSLFLLMMVQPTILGM